MTLLAFITGRIFRYQLEVMPPQTLVSWHVNAVLFRSQPEVSKCRSCSLVTIFPRDIRSHWTLYQSSNVAWSQVLAEQLRCCLENPVQLTTEPAVCRGTAILSRSTSHTRGLSLPSSSRTRQHVTVLAGLQGKDHPNRLVR